jgi:hypothetical protein
VTEGSGAAPARGPAWAEAELAWPLALGAGFVGAALGRSSGVQLAAPMVAALGLLPLAQRLLALERRALFALCAVGWALGVYAGSLALALSLPGRDEPALLLEGLFGRELGFLAGTRSAPVGAGPGGPWVPLALALALAAAARPAAGLLLWLGAGWILDGLAAGALPWVRLAVERGVSPAAAAVMALPPHLALTLAGTLVAAGALAGRGPVLPLSDLPPARRILLVAGSGLGVLGALARPLALPAWSAWIAASLS